MSLPAYLGSQRRIVLTGGPGAGKTAVLDLARRSFHHELVVVQEAATVVFGGGFPRNRDATSVCAAQRAIFHVQRELETVATADPNARVMLCDRGTLDGLAYWPLDEARFWEDVGSTKQAELARYQLVIHLHTPAAGNGYNHQNSLRVETNDEALALDRRVAECWKGHPRVIQIESVPDFMGKATRALAAIRAALAETAAG